MSHGAPKYTLRGLLIVTAACASVFGLARWLDDEAGLVLAIPLAVLPFTLILERVFGSAPSAESRQTPAWYLWRHLMLVPPALVPAAAAYASARAPFPTPSSPLPLLSVLPLLFGMPPSLLLAIPAVSFWILTFYLGRSASPQPMPLRFPILLGIATACSVLWFGFGWSYGVQYQGTDYTAAVTAINAVWMAILWLLWFVMRRSASMAAVSIFSILLLCWLFWSAFPWLGELP